MKILKLAALFLLVVLIFALLLEVFFIENKSVSFIVGLIANISIILFYLIKIKKPRAMKLGRETGEAHPDL